MNIVFLNPLIMPDTGLVLWAIIIFVILWIIVGKMAFKPIAKALNDRKNAIQDSLDAAKIAREEMKLLVAKNEDLLKEAKEERNRLIDEAKKVATAIVEKSKEDARTESIKLLENAQKEIEIQKLAAIAELKNNTGKLAIDLAETILKKELSDKSAQEALVAKLVEAAKLN